MADLEESNNLRIEVDEFCLWNRLKNNDKSGFEGLYSMYAHELMAFGLSIKPHRSLVKDCIQELFIDIWKYRKNLQEVKNVKMYLFKSLSNKIKKEINKENKRYLNEQLEGSDSLYSHSGTEFEFLNCRKEEKVNAELIAAMNGLPQRQKDVINYVFFDNLSHIQISQIMGINVQSVYTLTWKAICNLKKSFPMLFFLFNV